MIGPFTPGQLHEKLELKEVDLRAIVASKIRNAKDADRMKANDAIVVEKLERNLGELRIINPLLDEVESDMRGMKGLWEGLEYKMDQNEEFFRAKQKPLIKELKDRNKEIEEQGGEIDKLKAKAKSMRKV